MTHLKSKGFRFYMNDVKVGLPDRTKYYYPDVFTTKEPKSEQNQYIKWEPELIVEVVSPSSHITDTVDKYMAYTTIPALKYYLIVEPEKVYVTLFSKNPDSKWEAMTLFVKTMWFRCHGWSFPCRWKKCINKSYYLIIKNPGLSRTGIFNYEVLILRQAQDNSLA